MGGSRTSSDADSASGSRPSGRTRGFFRPPTTGERSSSASSVAAAAAAGTAGAIGSVTGTGAGAGASAGAGSTTGPSASAFAAAAAPSGPGTTASGTGERRRRSNDIFGRRRSSGRERTNHRITLQGWRAPDDLSASGLPAVRMSTLSSVVLPSTFHFEPLEEPDSAGFAQAGGHTGSFRSNGPLLEKKAGEREAQFYEDAQRGHWPLQFLPRYFGRCMVENEPAIRLENLTYGFSSPCVMDLKMGFQSVEDTEPSLLKRLRHTALDRLTGSKHSGVRLEGLSMHRTLEKRRMKGTKVQSHTVSANMGVSLQDVLTFFLTDESGVRTDIALRFQAHIEALLHYFHRYNRERLFIGSSILLIYDNDNSSAHMRWARALQRLHKIRPDAPQFKADQLATLTRRTKVDVRMIDFAHTGPMPVGQDKDEGYVQGLHTILTALKAIRADRKRPIFTVASAAVDALRKSNSEVDDLAAAGATGTNNPNTRTIDELEFRPNAHAHAPSSTTSTTNTTTTNTTTTTRAPGSGLGGRDESGNFNFATLYEDCSAVSTDSMR